MDAEVEQQGKIRKHELKRALFLFQRPHCSLQEIPYTPVYVPDVPFLWDADRDEHG